MITTSPVFSSGVKAEYQFRPERCGCYLINTDSERM